MSMTARLTIPQTLIFKIDYYTITWTLRDLLTNESLTNISYTEKVTGSQTVSVKGQV